jgi:UDP-2,3-diacylglucosamine hydrolase
MLTIGLTGGIGSGKSTVAALFAAAGVPIIDADVIAKEILTADKTCVDKVVAYFGSDLLDATGELDRSKLRELIFLDTQQRKWLEQLLHPLIIEKIKQRIASLNTPYCVVVIPLLVEVPETQQLVNRILVVDAPEETQIARACQRDQLSMEAVKKILASQATREQRLAIADDVIINESDKETLQQKVMQLHAHYLAHPLKHTLMPHTLFISDLHLEPERPDITQCFFNFLQHEAPKADALYILGDFFEVWIGDDENTPFQRTVIAALKQLTDTGFPVYFMRGNRDFLIGEAFIKATGCGFLPDPTVVYLYGKKILLAHGDALCTSDHKHQAFRKYAQNRSYNRFFLGLPLLIRRTIARLIRNASQKHTTRAPYAIMDVTQATVEQQMCEHDVVQLIHGHTHRPAIHPFALEGKSARRIVLGDWHTQGSALIYKENGETALVALDF